MSEAVQCNHPISSKNINKIYIILGVIGLIFSGILWLYNTSSDITRHNSVIISKIEKAEDKIMMHDKQISELQKEMKALNSEILNKLDVLKEQNSQIRTEIEVIKSELRKK